MSSKVLETKVLIVQTWEQEMGGRSDDLQVEVDRAIAALGKGWTVRSAQTHSCTRPGSTFSGTFDGYAFYPRTEWTTTIVMEKRE